MRGRAPAAPSSPHPRFPLGDPCRGRTGWAAPVQADFPAQWDTQPPAAPQPLSPKGDSAALTCAPPRTGGVTLQLLPCVLEPSVLSCTSQELLAEQGNTLRSGWNSGWRAGTARAALAAVVVHGSTRKLFPHLRAASPTPLAALPSPLFPRCSPITASVLCHAGRSEAGKWLSLLAGSLFIPASSLSFERLKHENFWNFMGPDCSELSLMCGRRGRQGKQHQTLDGE